MSRTNRLIQCLVAVLLVAAFLPIQAAQAGIMYTWDGDTSQVWNVATNWNVGDPPADPTNPPGSNINGSGGTVVDDEVVLFNPTTSGKTVSLSGGAGVDVGTIASLVIGGGGGYMTLKPNATGDNLTITGDVTLGGVDPADGTTQRPGNISLSQNNTTLTVSIGGNIVSGGTADNDIIVNDNNGTLTLAGDIDPGGAHEIDFTLNRGTFTWTGTTMNIEELNIVETATNGVNNTFTIGAGQTVTASARADVGRNTATGNTQRTVTGHMHIYGGTFVSTTTGESLVLGNVGADAKYSKNYHTAKGYVVVGDPAEPDQVSTMTLAGEMKVAPYQKQSVAGKQTAIGALTVNNAGSTVTIYGGVEMAANGNATNDYVDGTGSSTATITINDGLVEIWKHLEDSPAGKNQSTINLNGGRLHLASAGTITAPCADNKPRAVDTYNMADGATLQMTLSGQALPLTVNTTLDLEANGDTGGNAQIDLRTGVDAVVDPTEVVEWDGGAGTGLWDANAANWAPDMLPNQAAAPLVNGTTYVIIDGTTATVANLANAALVGPEAANWALDIVTNPAQLQATYNGPTIGTGPGTATISDATDVVGRTTDLLIGKVAGYGFDAAALEIYDGSLTLDDPTDTAEPNLIIEGDSGTSRTDQDVLVAGGALTINGNLDFGSVPGVGTGGTFRMTGGSTTILGAITYPGTGTSQVYVDGGTLTVAGDITCKSFRTGDNAGSTGTYTVPNGQTLTTTGYLQPGLEGNGTLIIEDGATVNAGTGFRVAQEASSVGSVIMNGGNLNVLNSASDIGYDGAGVLEIRAGTATLTGGETHAGTNAGSTGTIKVGEFGGAPTVYSVQVEVPQDGGDVTPSTFEMWSGTWYVEADNFLQGQTDTSQSVVTIHGGTIDLTGSAGTHTGNWNANKGIHTTDILGGLVRIGGKLQLTKSAASSLTFTIGDNLGADPTVLVGINVDGLTIDYRNLGADTVNLRSGTLDLTGGNMNPGGATGTNAFNWTGGTLKNVGTFTGDLTQDDTDSPSLLVIGNSPGQMNVTGDYTLQGGDIEMELLVDPSSGTKGVDWDLLNVTGTAAFNSGGQIILDLGSYIPALDDAWDIVDAATITTDYANIADLFDTTNADPGAGLAWDFSNFTTDGTVKVVPEPATLALLSLGAAASLVLRRRRA